MTKKRVLVTGATGFIGRQILAPLLERGFDVHAVSSQSWPAPRGGVTQHVCDLLDARGRARLIADVGATHLVHLAWYAAPGRFWTSERNLAWLAASLDLVEQFRVRGGQRAVVSGSCAEYDWRHDTFVEEVTPTAPATLYGACKHALHVALEAYARQSGLSLAWGRIFFVYGPHEAPGRLVSSVAEALLDGREAPCSEGEQVRDFQHVRDTAGAFAALADSSVSGAFNVASGRALRVKELALALADGLDARSRLRLGALPMAPGEPPRLVADVRRLRDEIGWNDRYDLASGVADTLAWWRSRMNPEKT